MKILYNTHAQLNNVISRLLTLQITGGNYCTLNHWWELWNNQHVMFIVGLVSMFYSSISMVLYDTLLYVVPVHLGLVIVSLEYKYMACSCKKTCIL